jgi:hypothetical protein
MFIGGVVTIQMGGLWHCFNHISGVGSSCSLSCQTRCQTRCLRGFINLAVSSLSHGLTWPWLGAKKAIFSDAPISSLLLVCHIISNYILIRLGYVYIYNMYHQCPWLFTLHYPMSWLNIPCFCIAFNTGPSRSCIVWESGGWCRDSVRPSWHSEGSSGFFMGYTNKYWETRVYIVI